jgi:4-methylaminobutanoate oxidase (formaldehyde-forming)
VGSLRLASSKDRLKALQREVSRARAIGIEADMISNRQALEIAPFLSDKDLYGAVYVPDDGHIDPSSVTYELARQARKRGAEINTGVRVTDIVLGGSGEISRVITDHGDIRTECVVCAAGQWTPRVAQMVGVDIPIIPMMNQYLTTKPIAGHELPPATPVIRDPDHLFYSREDVGAFLFGGFETNPKPWSPEGVPWDFSQQLLTGEWGIFEHIMEGAMKRIPMMAEAEAIELVNGPEAFTPDGFYLLGPVPGVRGFYVAAGGSDNGIAGSGGIGKLMSEWILEGEPSLDTHEMNVRRFGPHYNNHEYLVEHCREVIRYYYHLRYPYDENEWGRPLRTSPFYEKIKELGAVFGEKNGWERVNYFEPGKPWRRAGADQSAWGWGKPDFFDQVAQEVLAARQQAALIDMTSFGKIDVRGPGALAFLQNLAVSDLDKPVGSITYTQFLNPGGGIESDVTITRMAQDRFRVISGTAFVSNDLGWMTMHRPGDGSVTLEDVSEQWGCLVLCGPGSREILGRAASDDLSNGAFPYMTARSITVAGVDVWAQRISYTGELGWELYIPWDRGPAVWDALMEAGRDSGLRPMGYRALDSLRIEKGYLYWSGDITPEDNPLAAGLGFTVDFEKGDFIGRPALLEIREGGLKTRLSALVLDADYGLYGGESVYDGDKLVDRIRSAAFGHTVGKDIGLIYLPIDLAVPGKILKVEIFGRRVDARVSAMPLVDPTGEKLRS